MVISTMVRLFSSNKNITFRTGAFLVINIKNVQMNILYIIHTQKQFNTNIFDIFVIVTLRTVGQSFNIKPYIN